MQRRSKRMVLALAVALTGVLAAAPAIAMGSATLLASNEKHQGGGKKEKHKKGKGHESNGGGGERESGHSEARYFTDHHRATISGYFAQEYHQGNCPPGLAKKKNGCMPPGQAKKYAIGRRLPPDVIYYELPPRILVQLGPPPSHHKFVRVAEDILLLATGTGMVVDAIDNLSWEFGH